VDTGNGVIPRLNGLYVNLRQTGANALTVAYGLVIKDVNVGVTNYAIYSEGGQSYHAGNFGIGTTAPSEKLHVVGNTLLSDNSKALLGTGKDASIYYDATNLVINPKEVGTGYLNIKGQTLVDDKIMFTQTDGNEYIDSLADGYLDLGATIAVRSQGTFQTLNGVIGKITTVDDTYNILVTDETVICNKTTNFTITLPTAVVGQKFTIKNINTGTVTVDGAGTDTIDGSLTQSLIQWETFTLQCYIANKWGIE
jgi:hypothetical protein